MFLFTTQCRENIKSNSEISILNEAEKYALFLELEFDIDNAPRHEANCVCVCENKDGVQLSVQLISAFFRYKASTIPLLL